MKTILITGINGYLGSNLAKALKKDFHIIGLEYSLVNLYRLKSESFKVYEGSKEIPDSVFTEQKVDYIIHTATFYGRNQEYTRKIAESNLFLPFYLLDKAIANNCSSFINTDTVLDSKVSVYALTKNQFREWLQNRSGQIKVINMQLEHFYGPGCSNTNFITAMIERMMNNESEIDLTAGEQIRDFIYIDDLISAFEVVISKINELRSNFNHFQVCSGELIQLKELLLKIKTASGSSSKLNFGTIPYRENELMKSTSENKELLKLGWQPKNTIDEGIKKIIFS